MKCPHCGEDIDVRVAPLGSVVEGEVAAARAMVDLRHVAPCQEFLAAPFAVLDG